VSPFDVELTHPLSQANSALVKRNPKQLSKNYLVKNKHYFTFDFTDRLGVNRGVQLPRGNILLHSNSNQEQALAYNVSSQLLHAGQQAIILGFGCYLRLAQAKRISRDAIYIVLANLKQLDFYSFTSISHSFKSFLIFALTGLKLRCPLRGLVASHSSGVELLTSLGGNNYLRYYLLASLQSGEFLLSDRRQETIRTIN